MLPHLKSTETSHMLLKTLTNTQNYTAQPVGEPAESLNLGSSSSTPIHNAIKMRHFNVPVCLLYVLSGGWVMALHVCCTWALVWVWMDEPVFLDFSACASVETLCAIRPVFHWRPHRTVFLTSLTWVIDWHDFHSNHLSMPSPCFDG